MGLDIQTSHIGYDANNLQSLIDKIQTELIIDAINKIMEGVTTLEEHMPDYWVGDSADAFREKLDNDSQKLKLAFEDIYKSLESEIKQMMANVANSDNAVGASIRATISE
jgi:uncharacterized protein YukE